MAMSLLTLLDDITLLADDVAAMTKLAAKKTAGVLGDDIALNANQVSGFSPGRELPVVYAVAKGSAVNKLILVPLALALVAFAPWALGPLLIVGGAFLCYEGVEKVFHSVLHSAAEREQHHRELREAVAQAPDSLVETERKKIRAAVRTDFILSAEIVAISLDTMRGAPFMQQAVALSVISALFTVGVYLVVAAVVKMDDAGIYLTAARSAAARAAGRFILTGTPYFMRGLSIVGTAALFLVGGGIITHGVPFLHHIEQRAVDALTHAGAVAGAVTAILPSAIAMAAGFVVGSGVLAAVMLAGRFRRRAARG